MERIVLRYTPYRRPEKEDYFEYNSGEIVVETAGYIPQNIKVEQMLYAGQRLNEFRAEQYDYQPGQRTDDDYIDETREPGFDLADVSRVKAQLNERLKKRLKERKEKENATEAQHSTAQPKSEEGSKGERPKKTEEDTQG